MRKYILVILAIMVSLVGVTSLACASEDGYEEEQEQEQEEFIFPDTILMFGEGGVRPSSHIYVDYESAESCVIGSVPITIYEGASSKVDKKYIVFAFKSWGKMKGFLSSGDNRARLITIGDDYAEVRELEPRQMATGMSKYGKAKTSYTGEVAIAFVAWPAD